MMQRYYDDCQMGHLSGILDLMIECCVRFDHETWPFVSYIFYRSLDTGNLDRARILVEKALIDLAPSSDLDTMISLLRKAFEDRDDRNNLLAFETFLQNADELREKMTQISPDLRTNIIFSETRKHVIRMGRLAFENGSITEIEVKQQGEAASLNEEIQQLSSHLTEQNKESAIELESLVKKTRMRSH